MPRIAASTGARPRRAAHRAPRARRACAAACTIGLALAAAPAAAGGATGLAALDRAEQAVIVSVNRERSARGLRKLRADARLARAADAHSADMLARGYFGHDTPGGPTWSARIGRYLRARALGEVIGKLWRSAGAGAPGPRTEASRVVRLWMNSPLHRAVLPSRGLRRLGVARRVGRAQGGVETIYTVDFARRR